MPTRTLPDDPSLEHLKKEAKRLRNAVRAGDPAALALVVEQHPKAVGAAGPFSLADAQLVTARAYGFASWARLKQHLAAIAPFLWNPRSAGAHDSIADVFLDLACLSYAEWHRSNPDKALRLLHDHPALAHADIYTAAAAGNVEAVGAAIASDPSIVSARGGRFRWEPLLYACYSRLREAAPGYSTLEVARLLLRHGADPNAGFVYAGRYVFTALTGAFGEGEDGENNPPHPDRDALARALLDAGADPNDSQTLYNRHFNDDDGHFRMLFEYGLGQGTGGPWAARLGSRATSPSRLLVEELWSAAKRNRLARVALLLEHGADVNMPGVRDGRTPYEVALREGHTAMARYLLDRGATPMPISPQEELALACVAGDRARAQALLADDPALVDRLDHPGRVELVDRAVGANSLDGVRLIVELGIGLNGFVPGTGLDRSALHSAAMGGRLEMVKLLIELGADPHLHDPTFDSTPIGWAYHGGQREIVEYLSQFADIFDALRCDSVERVGEWLRTDPALANARDERGVPLVFYLHPDLARLDELLTLLRAHGCDVNARHPRGGTLLDLAMGKGLLDFADVLRRHGAQAT
jgi:ankyrin repeat protein